MSNPMVSVLMTAFNREKYIGLAIESALQSTFKDFELIIVDDLSSDKTFDIANTYAEKDRRIRIYRNKINLGQFKNRNFAASLAKGKYIKFLDSDDYLYPTGLQVLVTMMEQFPEAGFGLCSLIQDDRRIYPFLLKPTEAYIYNYFYKSIFHKAPLSSIIKRSAFEAVNGFEIESVCGDFAFWLHIASKFPVVLMPDGIVWYREHHEGEMQKARESPIIAFEYHLVEALYLKRTSFLREEELKQLLKKNKNKKIAFLIQLLKKPDFYHFLKIAKLLYTNPEYYFATKGRKLVNK